MDNRILPKEIPIHRARLAQEQNNVCPICELPFGSATICLDHSHDTGHLRSALCSQCNLMTGKLERAAKRTRNPKAFLNNAGAYVLLHAQNPSQFLHPAHLTKQERALKLRNRYARRKKKRLSNGS